MLKFAKKLRYSYQERLSIMSNANFIKIKLYHLRNRKTGGEGRGGWRQRNTQRVRVKVEPARLAGALGQQARLRVPPSLVETMAPPDRPPPWHPAWLAH